MAKLTHTERFHISRLFLFSILAVAILLARGEIHGASGFAYNKQVLAYATNMTRDELLSSANASRSANGLVALTLNAKLNNSAQAKAQHMIDYNYWAHIAPDGTQPWFFFTQAGYAYIGAGENLAYGFANGSEVTSAWMNSPTHKANILGDYVDVGFGIANSATYQDGENTVVVAHYGKPQTVTQSTPVPAKTPTPSEIPTSTAPSTPAPDSPAPTTSEPATVAEPDTSNVTEDTVTKAAEVPVATQDTTRNVTAWEQLTSGKAPLLITLSLGLVVTATAGFLFTHRSFARHLFADGKKFALHHPLLDITAVGFTVGIVLTTTIGKLL